MRDRTWKDPFTEHATATGFWVVCTGSTLIWGVFGGFTGQQGWSLLYAGEVLMAVIAWAVPFGLVIFGDLAVDHHLRRLEAKRKDLR